MVKLRSLATWVVSEKPKEQKIPGLSAILKGKIAAKVGQEETDVARTEIRYKGGTAKQFQSINSNRPRFEKVGVKISYRGKAIIVEDIQSPNPRHEEGVRTVKAAMDAARLEEDK